MSEFNLIDRYFKSLSKQRDDVVLGIGDDCAILSVPETKLLATSVDTLISGVHFPKDTSANDIGYKSLAVNLSDLAAMGAQPAWVSLAISLPNQDEQWLEEFAKGFAELINQYGLQLIGGDTTKGSLSITVQIFGFVDKQKYLRRDAAKPGDLIYVSGNIGDAGLGLKLKLNEIPSEPDFNNCIQALNRPVPRVELGQKLLDVSQCAIDISDGLLADLGHITKESHCGAKLYLENIPLSDEVKKYYAKQIDWQSVITSGDDYELCFTIEKSRQPQLETIEKDLNIKLTCIGEITNDLEVECLTNDGKAINISEPGFNHFK